MLVLGIDVLNNNYNDLNKTIELANQIAIHHPKQSVIKYPDRSNYNIIHSVNLKENATYTVMYMTI